MENRRRIFLQALSLATAGIACSLPVSLSQASNAESGVMDAIKAIQTRRSVRAFKADKVSEEDLQLLLNAAMQAPSAANEQPWELIVIRNPETLAKVGEINSYAAYAAKSPLAIMVCLNLEKEKISGMGIIDVSLCAENILLTAHALGLGAVFTGVYPMKDRMEKFQKLLDLPQNVLPIGLIIIGHPLMGHKPSENRFNKEATHFEKWQGK